MTCTSPLLPGGDEQARDRCGPSPPPPEVRGDSPGALRRRCTPGSRNSTQEVWNVPEQGTVGLESWREGPREDSGAVNSGWGAWEPPIGKTRGVLG